MNMLILSENGTVSNSVADSDEEVKKLTQQTFLTPLEVKKHVTQIWETYHEFLNVLLGAYPSPTAKRKCSSADMFFLEIFPVPPSRFRPVSVVICTDIVLLIATLFAIYLIQFSLIYMDTIKCNLRYITCM